MFSHFKCISGQHNTVSRATCCIWATDWWACTTEFLYQLPSLRLSVGMLLPSSEFYPQSKVEIRHVRKIWIHLSLFSTHTSKHKIQEKSITRHKTSNTIITQSRQYWCPRLWRKWHSHSITDSDDKWIIFLGCVLWKGYKFWNSPQNILRHATALKIND
jgi:hypothetical protein